MNCTLQPSQCRLHPKLLGCRRFSGLRLASYGLTAAQRGVATLVLQGRATREIMNHLQISQHTVQDHLKVVFDRTGVRSRRELVAALMG